MITLDTSALYALLDRRDPDHVRVLEGLQADPGPFLVPAGIMAELAYLVESRLGAAAMDAVLADLESGAYSLDCGEDDLARDPQSRIAVREPAARVRGFGRDRLRRAQRRPRAHARPA